MTQNSFAPVNGIIKDIQPMYDGCCKYEIILQTDDDEEVHFIIGFETYVINEVKLMLEMDVTAFYDTTFPSTQDYPPVYEALIIGQRSPDERMMTNHFDNKLVAIDQSIKINIGPNTDIVGTNGQPFTCGITNRLLIVYYSSTTQGTLPQTTPRKIIVPC